MQIEYLISAAIGFAVAMIFIILPSWYRLIKYQFQKYIENIVINFLYELQKTNTNGNIEQASKKEKKG
jgi:hypothetical protein